LLTDIVTDQKPNEREISITFLSYDSVFSKASVLDGSILDGVTFTQAFKILLTGSDTITNLLNYSDGNINPKLNLTIDEGFVFDGLLIKDALDKLLQAANSILLIDDSENIIIRSRDANDNTPHELYLNDKNKRDNINSIDSYNNGKQRMFNNVVVNNNTQKRDKVSIFDNDVNQQTFTLDFITTISKNGIIAQSYVDEFGQPKKEIILTIDKEESLGMVLFDKFQLSIELLTHIKNGVAPLYEYAEYDKNEYPIEISEFRILPVTLFKSIGFFENATKFLVTLKLREI